MPSHYFDRHWYRCLWRLQERIVLLSDRIRYHGDRSRIHYLCFFSMSYIADLAITDWEWDKMSQEEKLDVLYAPDDNEPWYQR